MQAECFKEKIRICLDLLLGLCAGSSAARRRAAEEASRKAAARAAGDAGGDAAAGAGAAAAAAGAKKKRKRRVRLPKGFDPAAPGPPPDPERWLPKWQRSDFKKKRRSRKDKVRPSIAHSAVACHGGGTFTCGELPSHAVV